jgi:DNA-binding transcriptional MerR regulator
MNFTLSEIGQLLEMRENPQNARSDMRALMQKKLQVVEEHLAELNTLRNEMCLLINLCQGTDEGCPIIEDIDLAS